VTIHRHVVSAIVTIGEPVVVMAHFGAREFSSVGIRLFASLARQDEPQPFGVVSGLKRQAGSLGSWSTATLEETSLSGDAGNRVTFGGNLRMNAGLVVCAGL